MGCRVFVECLQVVLARELEDAEERFGRQGLDRGHSGSKRCAWGGGWETGEGCRRAAGFERSSGGAGSAGFGVLGLIEHRTSTNPKKM